MASADVPFESPEEIAEKLVHFEELFKDRYTERDSGFHIALQRGSRWYQVPQMHPWPPQRPLSHRRRHGGYRPRGRERQYYGRPPRHYLDDREHWSGDRYRHRRQHRSRSPYRSRDGGSDGDGHYRGYRDRSPLHHSHPRHHSRSPEHRFRSRDHGSVSPRPPHHVPDHRHSRSRSPSHSPQSQHASTKNNEEGSKGNMVSEEGEEESVKEKGKTSDASQVKPTSALALLGAFGEEQEKTVPSDSDVLAILTSASAAENTITSEDLKQVQKEAQSQMHKKERQERGQVIERSKGKSISRGHMAHTRDSDGGIEDQAGLHGGQHSGGLLISHGKTENVLQSLVLPQTGLPSARTFLHETKRKKKRKRKIVISDDEEETLESSHTEDEQIDVVGTTTVVKPLVHQQQAYHTTDSAGQECQGPLVLRFNRQYLSPIGDTHDLQLKTKHPDDSQATRDVDTPSFSPHSQTGVPSEHTELTSSSMSHSGMTEAPFGQSRETSSSQERVFEEEMAREEKPKHKRKKKKEKKKKHKSSEKNKDPLKLKIIVGSFDSV